MAILKDVKIIDMKVEYKGIQYEKIEGAPQVGDLIRADDKWRNLNEGEFFICVSLDCDGDAVSKLGHVHFRHHYDVFRKGKTADEAGKAIEVGDIIRITSGSNGYSKVGDICRVVEDDGSLVRYRLESLNGEYRGWKAGTSITKVLNEEEKWNKLGRKEGDFKQGDIVRVTQLGAITGVFTELKSRRRGADVFNLGKAWNHSYDSGWLGENQFELIVPVEKRVE